MTVLLLLMQVGQLELELSRFPPRAVVAEVREQQRAQLDYLAFQIENGFGDRDRQSDARAKLLAVYTAWDKLDDAQNSYSPLWLRQLAMEELRRLLGDADFATGAMPYWR